MILLKPKINLIAHQNINTQKINHAFLALYSTDTLTPIQPELKKLHTLISTCIGSLNDLEASLNPFALSLTSTLVTQIIDSCKNEAPSRRILRFFLWSSQTLDSKLEDHDFNHAIRIFAEKKDFTAIDILLSDLCRQGRAMENRTFSIVAETLVKLGREDRALKIFNHLDKFKCSIDKSSILAIVNALCGKGHARIAETILSHHKDKIFGVEASVYKRLLYGWSEQKNVKESQKILKEMKSKGMNLDIFCYNTFLRCLCEQNLKSNPSGLVPSALNVMMEMRATKIEPNAISYNLLLSCLGRARRVKDCRQILSLMKGSGCSPDYVTYCLVARVLFLSGRFGAGKQIIEEMIAESVTPQPKFYYDLVGVLCGVERVSYAVELFEQMKKLSLGRYGPVYDVLIPKLCRGGDFEKGRELWDEAMRNGVTLCCSSDVLDPSITEVFRPTKKIDPLVNISVRATLQ